MTVSLNKENKILCTASLKYIHNVLCLVTQRCPTLRLLCPWGFCRQEYWSGLPCPSPDIYNKRIQKDWKSKEIRCANTESLKTVFGCVPSETDLRQIFENT